MKPFLTRGRTPLVYLLKSKFLRNNPFKPVYLIKNAEPVAAWSDDKPNLRDWRQLNWFALSLMTSLPGFEVRKMLDQICGQEKRLLVIDVKFCRVNVDNHSCKILIEICYTILYYTKLSTCPHNCLIIIFQKAFFA